MSETNNQNQELSVEHFEQIDEAPKLNIVRAGFKSTVTKVGGSMRDMGNVPLEALTIRKGYNVRLRGQRYEQRVNALAQSIVANGYRQDKPITCSVEREGSVEVIYVVSGHTRLAAIHKANEQGADIRSVPVICIPEGTTSADLTLDLMISNDGEPLTMYEQGLVNERLVRDEGLTAVEVARRQGVTEGHIRNTLELRKAPAQIVQWFADGVVSETFALEIMRKHGDKAVQVIQKALDKAAMAGKTKVTASAVDGPKIPAKVSVAAVSAVEGFVNRLDENVLRRVVADPEQDQGAQDDEPVSIPAGLLRELLKANTEIESFRQSLVEKEEKAKERQVKERERQERREKRQALKAEREARALARAKEKLARAEALEAERQSKSSLPAMAARGNTISVSASEGYERDRSEANDVPNYDDDWMNQADD